MFKADMNAHQIELCYPLQKVRRRVRPTLSCRTPTLANVNGGGGMTGLSHTRRGRS